MSNHERQPSQLHVRQLWTIAKLTFTLPFRRRSGWVLLALLAGVTLFMFMVSRSDGILVNELRLRLRFSLYFANALLSLVLLWYACLSMRGDIDAKRLHLVTSYPIPRIRIYLGKWLGLMLFAGIGLLTSMAMAGAAAGFYVRSWDKPEEVTELRRRFLPVREEIAPKIPDAYVEARKAVREAKARGAGLGNQSESEFIEQLRRQIIRRQQLVPKNGERRWLFELQRPPPPDTELVFNYRFYAHEDTTVHGQWSMAVTDDGENYYEVAGIKTTSRPAQTHELKFPASQIRPNGRLVIAFRGLDSPDVVFQNHNGLKLFYRRGSWIGNILACAIALMAHFAVVIAAGLTIATAFTLSVASFVSMVLYFLAQASDFFQRFLNEVRIDAAASPLENIGGVIIRIALFFTTGLEPPAAVLPLSEAVRITPANLGMEITRQAGSIILSPVMVFSDAAFRALQQHGVDLYVGYALYLAIVAGFGIFLLRRKELDRVH